MKCLVHATFRINVVNAGLVRKTWDVFSFTLCKLCNVVQSVDHILLHCKGSIFMTNGTTFENKLCKYVSNYHNLSDDNKLQIVLNCKPLWKKVNENEACEPIYTFVKNTYQSAQGMNFSTSLT